MEGYYHFNIFSWILLASSTAGIWLFFLLRQAWRNAHEAKCLSFFSLAVGEWALANLFENAGMTYELKLLWSQISYVGIVSAPVFAFMFALGTTGKERHLTVRNLVLVSLVPAATLIMAFTNELHNLLWTYIHIQPRSYIAIYGHGPWFWIFIIYVYLLMSASLAIYVIPMIRYPRYYRLRNIIFTAGFLLPLVGNAMYILELNPLPGMDWGPVFFLVSCVLFAIGILRFRIFDVVPVARSLLVETMGDGLIVLDEQDRVLDLNPSMINILGGTREIRMGVNASVVFSAWPEILDRLDDPAEGFSEIAHVMGDDVLYFDMRITTLFLSASRKMTGKLIVLRDITKRKRLENEREKLIRDLREASNQVSTLRGLLPICASCKKIRDDKGYWHGVEAYIGRLSGVEFTHGLCPECLKKLTEKHKDEESGKET